MPAPPAHALNLHTAPLPAPLATSAAQAFVNLLLGELGLAILVGGAVGLYILWYLRGRDKPHGLIAEYLREPPSDLHPGLVGTLLDEHANSHDVVATLVNLGNRGILRFAVPEGPDRQPTHEVVLLRRDLPLSPVEALLIEVLFGIAGRPFAQRARLEDLRPKFVAAIPRFKVALYEEVIAEGFFLASPRETRLRYRARGATLMVLAVVVGIPAAFVIPGARLLLVPAVALTIIGFALWHLARAMPAKTPQGVEEAARWLAFRRYLEGIERYEDLRQARDIFNRYLPYATAFGLDRAWVEKFTRVDAPAPRWLDTASVPTTGGGSYDRVIITDLPSFGGGHGGGISGGPPNLGTLPDLPDLPDLGGATGALGDLASGLPDVASAAGGAGLEAASDALSGLLDAAGSLFDW